MCEIRQKDLYHEKTDLWCERVTEFSQLEALSARLQAWSSPQSPPNIFQQSAWIRAFWRTYQGSSKLLCLVVHERDCVVGILPLIERDGTIQFLGSPDSDCNDLLCSDGMAPRVLETALNALLQPPFEWRSGRLDNIPANSKIIRSIPSLPFHLRKHLQLVYHWPSPTILLGENRQDVLKIIAEKALRHRHKKLSGEVTFRHIESREEIQGQLDNFFRQHITRWAAIGVRSQFLQPEKRVFYRALVEELNPCNQLRFSILEHNSKPIAYHFGFQQGGRFVMYTPSFDLEYADYGPGHVLLSHLFKYAKGAGLTEFDFSLGDEAYKYRFANYVRKTYVLHLEPHPFRIRSGVARAIRSAEDLVRKDVAWQTAAKTMIDSLRNHRKRLVRAIHKFTPSVHANYARILWRRQEILVYATAERFRRSSSRVGIIQATLSALVAVLAEQSNVLDVDTLREYRTRLKNGDRLFIARTPLGEIHILWVGQRSELTSREIGIACRIPLPEPVDFVYDSWVASQPELPAIASEILAALAEHLPQTKLCICAAGFDEYRSKAIEQSGFSLQYILSCRALLGCFPRGSVVPLAKVDGDFPRAMMRQAT